MFSTVDATRVVRVTLVDEDRRAVVPTAAYFGAKEWVSKLPSDFLLLACAKLAAADVWVPGRSGSRWPVVSWRRDVTPRQVVVPRAVQVATYRLQYDRATAELRLAEVRSACAEGPTPEQIARRLRVPVESLDLRRIADVVR
jgi:hypothetical protein